MTDGDGDGKVLIGDMEKASFVLNNYSNSITINNIDGVGYLSGYVNDGWYMDSTEGNNSKYIDSEDLAWFDVRVYNSNLRIWEKVQLYYDISGKYDITIDGKTYNGIEFNTKTTYADFYLDKQIDHIDFWHEASLAPDGNKVNTFWLQFINADWYYIHSLDTDFLVEDHWRKNIDTTVADYKFKTFDIDEFTSSYDKWFSIKSFDTSTDMDGKLKFGLVSYKPAVKAQFDITLQNITGDSDDFYDWSQANRTIVSDEFSFYDIVNLDFVGDVVNKWISVNIANELEIQFSSDSSYVSSSDCGYDLYGTIKWCSDCVFSGWIWSNFSSTWFGNVKKEIFVYGSVEPNAVDYYDQKYYYRLTGVDGVKDINLKPNIDTSNLRVVWKLIEPMIIWLVARSWYNTNNITVIDTKLPVNAFITRYVQKIKDATAGKKEDFVSNSAIDLATISDTIKIYKCANDTMLDISGTYNQSMALYFKIVN